MGIRAFLLVLQWDLPFEQPFDQPNSGDSRSPVQLGFLRPTPIPVLPTAAWGPKGSMTVVATELQSKTNASPVPVGCQATENGTYLTTDTTLLRLNV